MSLCPRSFLNQRLLTEVQTSLHAIETRLDRLDERLQTVEASATTLPMLASSATFPDRIEELEQRIQKLDQMEVRIQKIDDLEARLQKLAMGNTAARRLEKEKLPAAKIKPSEGQNQPDI
jgi:hypothetical protein